MRVTRVIAIGVIAASLGLGVVHAQSFSAMDSPAEFPPSDYKGKQYVDSRGCVYIRAGIDGNTTWVPRVSRDRKVICGFKPTFDEPVAGTVKPPKLDRNVVTIAPAATPTESPAIFGTSKPKTAAPAATATAAKPKAAQPAPKTVAKTTPKPKTATATTTAVVATKPKTATGRTTTSSGQPLYTTPVAVPPTATTTPKPAATTTTTAPRRTTTQPARAAGSLSPCRGGASTYKGMKVRCGPQSESPVTPGSGNPTAASPKMQFDRQSSLRRGTPGQIVREGEVSPDTRVLPRHVYETNLATLVKTDVPEGYRRVFDDGRLNPRRAEMTFAGKAQSDQIWTRKTPRRLIQRKVGDTVVVSSKSSSWAAPYEPEPEPAPVVSSRSGAAEKTLRLSGTPYVQVGTYADSDTAQAVARQVRELGLPVRIGKYQRGQDVRSIVLAGPFSGTTSAEAALDKAQGAGFAGAFLR